MWLRVGPRPRSIYSLFKVFIVSRRGQRWRCVMDRSAGDRHRFSGVRRGCRGVGRRARSRRSSRSIEGGSSGDTNTGRRTVNLHGKGRCGCCLCSGQHFQIPWSRIRIQLAGGQAGHSQISALKSFPCPAKEYEDGKPNEAMVFSRAPAEAAVRWRKRWWSVGRRLACVANIPYARRHGRRTVKGR